MPGSAFGEPLSLKAFIVDHRGEAITGVGEALRDRVRTAIPVLPVPLVAWLLRRAGGPVTRADLVAGVAPYLHRIEGPRLAAEPLVDEALTHLSSRRIVTEAPDGIRIDKDHAGLAAYYANSVAHLLQDPPDPVAQVATAHSASET